MKTCPTLQMLINPSMQSSVSILPTAGTPAYSLDQDKDIERKSANINYNSVSRVFHITMPGPMHNCPNWWFNFQIREHGRSTGFLNTQEYLILEQNSNTSMLSSLTSCISN